MSRRLSPAPRAFRSEVPRETSRHDARHHLAACRSLFPLRGPLARPPAACRRSGDGARDRGDQRAAQSMERALLQRAAGPQLGELRQRAPVFLRAGRQLHRARRVPALPQPVAPDPLAQLDDAALCRQVARSRQPLPHAAPRRRRRQPGPENCRGHPAVHRRRHGHRRPADRSRPAELRGDACVLQRHLVGPVVGGSLASVRHHLGHPRLHGVGRAALLTRRYRDHPLDRAPPHRTDVQPAAL